MTSLDKTSLLANSLTWPFKPANPKFFSHNDVTFPSESPSLGAELRSLHNHLWLVSTDDLVLLSWRLRSARRKHRRQIRWGYLIVSDLWFRVCAAICRRGRNVLSKPAVRKGFSGEGGRAWGDGNGLCFFNLASWSCIEFLRFRFSDVGGEELRKQRDYRGSQRALEWVFT